MEPPFIPVPQLSEPVRPPNQIFVWGTGNFGQFGFGPEREVTGEVAKPKRQTWIERKVEEGEMIKGGVVGVAAGGMHSLFSDEEGNVSCVSFISCSLFGKWCARFGCMDRRRENAYGDPIP